MPVSKKRKKDGKPVHRQEQASPAAEHDHGPEAKAAAAAAAPAVKVTKPSNPFTAQRTMVRSAQRGR
jgi:hypothetical protein